MPPYIVTLRSPLSPEDESWNFRLPTPIPASRPGRGKLMIFTPENLTLQIEQFPSNRVLYQDQADDFILASFGALRFKDHPPSAAADYILRVLTKGVFLDGRQYRFYHHSNSQLRSRSCWLRAAQTDEELDRRIQGLCDVSKINNIAKRAKRIGLLFSGAEIDWDLDPKFTKDIPDITVGEELFSDGCGLMSQKFMQLLAKKKKIIHRQRRYIPSVVQIRYRGYKGVLMIHPELDREAKHHVHFRDSMRKLKTTSNNTFSAVDYSRPYQFARLNNDIVVLLSALGITTETLVAKQQAYFEWIEAARTDTFAAINFLDALGKHSSAERVLLDGIDSESVQTEIKAAQAAEVTAFRKPDTEKERCRIFLLKSRFLFGVCDPYGILEEGEVHVRILEPRMGPTTLSGIDLMVVRNPCLHPGDILKLRAVHHTKLDHLVDCIVFSGKGKRAAPSMSSGGDLDGDRFTVVWDPEIVPKTLAQSYNYPPARSPVNMKITRKDLATHFANYNKVAALHIKWARAKGAMSPECQQLNALHSQSVDGARIRIPDPLTIVPEVEGPFVLDILAERARHFAAKFNLEAAREFSSLDKISAASILKDLLTTDGSVLSASTENEIVQLCLRFAARNSIDIRDYLQYINFDGLSTEEKYGLSSALHLTAESHPFVWNRQVLLQNLGRAAFFEYLKRATVDFSRKLIIIKTDDRFGVGIFVRGKHTWDEDAKVNRDVLVHAFQPSVATGGQLARPTKTGYILHASDGVFQLFERHRENTFIFLNFATAFSRNDVNASIALAKISDNVKRQIGRIQKTPVQTLEIHVVSNRDRVGQEFFDLRFSHVQTEEVIPRFQRELKTYVPRSVKNLQQLANVPEATPAQNSVGQLFLMKPEEFFREVRGRENHEIEDFMQLAWTHNAHAYNFYLYEIMCSRISTPSLTTLRHWLGLDPALVYALLKVYEDAQGDQLDLFQTMDEIIIRSVVLSANTYQISASMTLERLHSVICRLTFREFAETMWLVACSVRALALSADIMATLMETRRDVYSDIPARDYAHRHIWGICLDRAEDANSQCPCTDDGRPRRQRDAPALVPLVKTEDEKVVDAHPRIDLPNHVRLHAHVRLQAASQPERGVDPRGRPIMDGVVSGARRGQLRINLLHNPPIDIENIQWHLYPAGDVVTSRAMFDAVVKLHTQPQGSTSLHYLLTGNDPETIWDETERKDPEGRQAITTEEPNVVPQSAVSQAGEGSSQYTGDWEVRRDAIEWDHFNSSQKEAIMSIEHPLSLVWGPPGTGKTTVVIAMLRLLLGSMPPGSRILMTASTHNAVDNVLERFIQENSKHNIIPKEQLLRVATDIQRVQKSLHDYTIDALVGGNTSDNPKLLKKAEKRVRESTIVFSTCAGAGLGILRRFKFEIVLIDEASQITEACALIPLVKGCQRAVLVGDHVQLRPTVQIRAKALDYDVSLLERLYTGPEQAGMSRIMLDTQYRFPDALARFPSREFYNSGLKTGVPDGKFDFSRLEQTAFPWPRGRYSLNTNVFVSCKGEESYEGASKENVSQADTVMRILDLLRTNGINSASSEHASASMGHSQGATTPLSVTILSPYSRQVRLLRARLQANPSLAANTNAFTIDGFQGREAEIIVFTTVRSNASGDIGFLEDERRLNVALTRAQLGRIIVGNETTLCAGSEVWDRAVKDCTRVELPAPTKT
ncbi:RNA-dependent RNA polymerase [Ceratobasidium sp. AG-Ba]|nr:RNA-dependent RNA polymerase [Ceratobasidium sp. AG-Ba]